MLLVFLGGGLGSVCRWQLSTMIPTSGFPWATLAANSLASFILGWLASNSNFGGGFEVMGLNSKQVWLLLGTGFCGGFSTFSTFSLESMKLLESNLPLGLANIGANLLACLLLVSLGYFLGKTQ